MSEHVVIWQFRVHAEHVAAFEAAYGPAGDWARLFGRADGYLGTELLRDDDAAGRYVTVDRWRSPADLARFRDVYGGEYAALDARCQAWTFAETRLGAFEAVGGEDRC